MEILYRDASLAVCVKPVGLDSEAEVPAALKAALGVWKIQYPRVHHNVM